MQAIRTKYYGPTNFRGSRIKAEAQAGSRWMEWDHALMSQPVVAGQTHEAAEVIA